jgi:hypothetical protein
MNECLLTKWIVKLKRGNNDMCTSLPTHGQFSTAFPGAVDVRMEEMWQSKLPLKVLKNIWLIYQNRIQTSDNLRRKQWE